MPFRFQTLKSHLKKHKYPGISSLTDDQIVSTVLQSENRCFLISWIAKQLDVEISDDNPTWLSEFVGKMGFCRDSEKLPFINGDPEFDSEQQILILNRMLEYVSDFNETKDNSMSIPMLSEEEFEGIVKRKTINLFPTEGPIKTRKTNDRLKKIENLLKEYEELKGFELEDDDRTLLESTNGTSVEFDGLDGIVSHFEENCADLKRLKKEQFCLPYKLEVTQQDLQKIGNDVSSIRKVIESTKTVTNMCGKEASSIKDEVDPRFIDALTALKELNPLAKDLL